MYVQPDTVIKILHDVPLDETYEHTIYFANLSEQETYFNSKVKGANYVFNAQSYQRVQRGVMRIQKAAEDLYDCNYLMFRNTHFGNKWFYAFIQSVEYVNNEVSEITFEIDVMQTWYFDYQLGACFVEREHTVTDNMFENLVPENLDLGDNYVNNNTQEIDLNTMRVAVLVTRDPSAQYVGHTYANIYSPLDVGGKSLSTSTELLDQVINDIVNAGGEDRIVAIYQYPDLAYNESGTFQAPYNILGNVATQGNRKTLDGYEPINNKLYSYPYNYLLLSDNAGQASEYHYENFNNNWYINDQLNFMIQSVYLTMPAVALSPMYYKNIAIDWDSGIIMKDFPVCAWTGDAFKQWWALNKNSVITGGIIDALTAVGMGALPVQTPLSMPSPILKIENPRSTNPYYNRQTEHFTGIATTRALSNAASSTLGTLAKTADLKRVPPQVHGHAQCSSIVAGANRYKFSFYKMSIKAQFARIIDNYFSKYGYAVHTVKVPNTHARTHWTYTKTNGCVITGSVPSDDGTKICSIFDNGITFWVDPDEVGQFTRALAEANRGAYG